MFFINQCCQQILRGYKDMRVFVFQINIWSHFLYVEDLA